MQINTKHFQPLLENSLWYLAPSIWLAQRQTIITHPAKKPLRSETRNVSLMASDQAVHAIVLDELCVLLFQESYRKSASAFILPLCYHLSVICSPIDCIPHHYIPIIHFLPHNWHRPGSPLLSATAASAIKTDLLKTCFRIFRFSVFPAVGLPLLPPDVVLAPQPPLRVLVRFWYNAIPCNEVFKAIPWQMRVTFDTEHL